MAYQTDKSPQIHKGLRIRTNNLIKDLIKWFIHPFHCSWPSFSSCQFSLRRASTQKPLSPSIDQPSHTKSCEIKAVLQHTLDSSPAEYFIPPFSRCNAAGLGGAAFVLAGNKEEMERVCLERARQFPASSAEWAMSVNNRGRRAESYRQAEGEERGRWDFENCRPRRESGKGR